MRVRIYSDVPIHRGSVGAMGLALGSQMPDRFETKRYVYRGWGHDLFEEPPPRPRPPKPEPKARRRKSKPRVPRPLDIMDTETWGNWPRQPKPHTYRVAINTLLPPVPKPPPPTVCRPIRPAPGWKPLTLADLDALLEEG